MKLNTMMYVSNLSEQLAAYLAGIEQSESYEDAKNQARFMIGCLNGAITLLNTMICLENNGVSGDLGDVIDSWFSRMYQAMADKASTTHQPEETIFHYYKLRDEYRVA